MPNYKGRGQVLLYETTLTGTSNSITYTPSNAITKSIYKRLYFTIAGSNTATLVLHMKISAKTSYNTGTILNDAGTVTSTYAASAGTIDLIPIVLLDEARFFISEGTIDFADAQLFVNGNGHAGGEGTCVVSSEVPSTTTISSIEFKVSTSTLAIGTVIQIWGQL